MMQHGWRELYFELARALGFLSIEVDYTDETKHMEVLARAKRLYHLFMEDSFDD